MIVKDEAHVIERCLRSVIPVIDCWCIVDTGSTDGTQAIVQSVLANLPGVLHERPWRDFGQNRTEAIGLASPLGDYLFFIDADEVLEISGSFSRTELIADAYLLTMVQGIHEYRRVGLVSTRLIWHSVGVLHEYLESNEPCAREFLPALRVVAFGDGGRSRGIKVVDKYRRDAETLERALIEEPGNARYVFYLAQSYRDSQQFALALETYRRRAAMGGWDEEVWFSLLEVARLGEKTGATAEVVATQYLKAYQFRPVRAEPLVALARLHRLRQEYALSHLYAERARHIPRPTDILFLDTAVYDWIAADEYAIACYWTERYSDSKQACLDLLAGAALPQSEHARVEQNLEFAEKALRTSAAP